MNTPTATYLNQTDLTFGPIFTGTFHRRVIRKPHGTSGKIVFYEFKKQDGTFIRLSNTGIFRELLKETPDKNTKVILYAYTDSDSAVKLTFINSDKENDGK